MTADPLDIEHLKGWLEVVDDSNYYEILGVLDIADETAIREAFREFALAFHPDRHVGAATEARSYTRYVFRRGAEAYRVLKDPELRALYDHGLTSGALRLIGGAEAASSSVPSGRSLEDICRSRGSKLLGRRADECLSRGELAPARKHLRAAFLHDRCDNPDLEDCLDAIDQAMFAQGD